MVKQLMGLKLKMAWNTLSKNTPMLIMSIIGTLMGMCYIGFGGFGMAYAGHAGDIQGMALASIIGGTVVVLAWILGPVLAANKLDNTIDPVRFSPYIGPSRSLCLGFVVATGVGIAGFLTVLVALLPTVGWIAAGNLVAIPFSLIGAALGLFIAFVWTRIVNTWLSMKAAQSSRFAAIRTAVGAILVLILYVAYFVWLMPAITAMKAIPVKDMMGILSWTPVGAPWALGYSAASGQWLLLLAQLVITLVTVGVGFAIWEKMLPWAMTGSAHPVSRQAIQAIKDGRYLVDPTLTPASSSVRAGATSGTGYELDPNSPAAHALKGVELFENFGLNQPTASLAARTLKQWITDTRLNTVVGLLIVLPIIIGCVSKTSFAVAFPQDFVIGFYAYMLVGTFMAVGSFMAYDSTASWILIASGIRGRDERLGRLAGSLPIAVVVIAVNVLVLFLFSLITVDQIGYVASALILLVGAAMGTTLIMHARWISAIKTPGASSSKTTGAGSGMTGILLVFTDMITILVAVLPAGIPLLLSFKGIAVPAFIAIPWAIIWALALMVAGVIFGGKLWDKHSVDLLTEMRSLQGNATSA